MDCSLCPPKGLQLSYIVTHGREAYGRGNNSKTPLTAAVAKLRDWTQGIGTGFGHRPRSRRQRMKMLRSERMKDCRSRMQYSFGQVEEEDGGNGIVIT